MRQVTTGTALTAVLFLAGCNWPWVRNDMPKPPPPAVGKNELPRSADLVAYLNKNAVLIQGLSADVDIEARQGNQPIGLTGLVAAQKPRNFRLKANIFGKAGVDLGSNNDEFWYWISKADPPYVFHCAYNDLPKVSRLPFPFQPDMVLTALGISEYDPNKQYTVRANGATVELIEATESPQKQPVFKTTVFARTEVGPGKPQVLAYVLQDVKGNVLCRANVEQISVDSTTRAVVPARVRLVWPAEKMELTLRFMNVKVGPFDAGTAEKLFTRRTLDPALKTVDLARWLDAGPQGVTQETGLQRTSGRR